ncbi:YybH family protein [Paraburkholderia sp. RL17-381-BIF-C]|uniref:YybH family protein n=1 Tax=Paraburkholderia sp. RL17-381-BIF-C TaxID=3031635 RepID=UPI0038BA801E
MRQPEDALHAFQNAWNRHDMESLGALFHEDATFVNRFGHYVRGVEAIIELHAVDTLILAVLTRQAGEWRIKALENVTLTNPRTGEAILRDGRVV